MDGHGLTAHLLGTSGLFRFLLTHRPAVSTQVPMALRGVARPCGTFLSGFTSKLFPEWLYHFHSLEQGVRGPRGSPDISRRPGRRTEVTFLPRALKHHPSPR